MDLKVLFLGVCLCVFAVTYSQAGIPKCCMSTKKGISRQILRNVKRWENQESTGACDIPAVILHLKNYERPICADPEVERFLRRFQNRKRRSHHKDSD